MSLERAQQLFGSYLPEEQLKRFWSRCKKRRVFILWRNGLWVQYYKNDPRATPSVVSVYPEEILERYRQLTQEHLESFWREALATSEAHHYKCLIALTLERRDQLLLNSTI